MSTSLPVPPAVVAERLTADLLHLAAAIVRVGQAIEQPLDIHGPWIAGDQPAHPFALTDAAVEQYLHRLTHAHIEGISIPCCLTPTGGSRPVTVYVHVESMPAGQIARLSFVLRASLAPDAIMALLPAVAEAFGAGQAWLEDPALLDRYRSRSLAERALAITPAEFQSQAPSPAGHMDTDINVSESLLPHHEYDALQVPANVWWINYWAAPLVAALGETRVRTAGWARVSEAGQGALVLVATEQRLDPENRQHLEQLRQLIDHLGLRQAQVRARYRGGRMLRAPR